MLYEVLTGEPPHDGTTAQAIIAKVITDRPRGIRLSRATVPPHVEAAVDRALAKLPADRFHSARDFADAITGSGTHRFDAGTMGCADGLAREFRRRILAIPLGDILEVETTDPAAKEDLPPLARMMGHTVRSTESTGDGRLLIEVERGR